MADRGLHDPREGDRFEPQAPALGIFGPGQHTRLALGCPLVTQGPGISPATEQNNTAKINSVAGRESIFYYALRSGNGILIACVLNVYSTFATSHACIYLSVCLQHVTAFCGWEKVAWVNNDTV